MLGLSCWRKTKGSCGLAAFTRIAVPRLLPIHAESEPEEQWLPDLVAGTELLAPGASLPKHRHLVQDEILLIQSGTAHVWLGEQERDLHAGGLVFIPANTWISGKNIGAEPIALTFIFSAPGFEETMRCNSVPAGETPTQITPEQQRDCAHLGHSESAGRPDNPKK